MHAGHHTISPTQPILKRKEEDVTAISAAALQEEEKEEEEDIALHPPLLLTSPSFQRAGALASLAPFSPPFGIRREMEAAGRGHSGGLCNLRPIQNCFEKWVLVLDIRQILFLYTKKLKTQFVKTAVSQTFLNFDVRRFLSSCGWGSVVAERTEKLFCTIIKPSFQNPGGGCQ